jgi:hypothetical protein
MHPQGVTPIQRSSASVTDRRAPEPVGGDRDQRIRRHRAQAVPGPDQAGDRDGVGRADGQDRVGLGQRGDRGVIAPRLAPVRVGGLAVEAEAAVHHDDVDQCPGARQHVGKRERIDLGPPIRSRQPAEADRASANRSNPPAWAARQAAARPGISSAMPRARATLAA